MSHPLPVNRDLLNPKFESYKLSNLNESQIFRCPLPAPGVIQHTVADGSKLMSFEEMQYRIKYNHISCISNTDEIFYVSKDGNIVVVDLDEVR